MIKDSIYEAEQDLLAWADKDCHLCKGAGSIQFYPGNKPTECPRCFGSCHNRAANSRRLTEAEKVTWSNVLSNRK